MIQIDSKAFSDAFNTAGEDKKELMRNTVIHDCILESLIKLAEEADSKEMILSFGYTILGLINKTKLHEELGSLGIKNPETFSSTVFSCINDKSRSLSVASTGVSTPDPTPIQTEATYTSTQSAILNESRPGTGWETR